MFLDQILELWEETLREQLLHSSASKPSTFLAAAPCWPQQELLSLVPGTICVCL